MPKYRNMTNHKNFSNFLSEIEEYEKVHALWYAKLIANGRQAIQSVHNSIDNEHLTNLIDSFMKFVSLLALCNSNILPEKITLDPNEQSSIKQNKNTDLVSKNDIIKMVNNDLLCPICNEWLLKATSANCNHTFCEKCIKKWLRMNKTCPVCRSSVQYISTSLAIDNFLSNLCQLFGGIIKERRESVKNTQDNYEIQTSLNDSVDMMVNDLSISTESLVEDTYYNSLLETTTPFPHPNMVRLIPLQSDSPESRTNLRQVVVSSHNVYRNEVELLPFPRSSICSHPNQVQLTYTSVTSPLLSHIQSTPTSTFSPRTNCQRSKLLTSVVASTVNIHPNAVELLPFPRPSITGSRPNQDQLAYTSVTSPQLNRFQSTSTATYGSYTNCIQLKPLTSMIKPRNCHSQLKSTISTVSPQVKFNHPTSSTSMVNQHDCHLQR